MAVNFRLAYNEGLSFVDLFPQSSVQAITDVTNLLQYSTINVTIPVPTTVDVNQTVAITTTTAQVNAPVEMYLVSTGNQAQSDYNTITQFSVTENQLNLTRLYEQPVGEIEVQLVFKEAT